MQGLDLSILLICIVLFRQCLSDRVGFLEFVFSKYPRLGAFENVRTYPTFSTIEYLLRKASGLTMPPGLVMHSGGTSGSD